MRTQGFTLLEMMVTLSVTAIVLGLGMPALADTVAHHRAITATHLLSSHFALARNTAITSRTPISVCASRDGEQCNADSDWGDGWLVYRDPKKSGQPASSDAILRRGVPAKGATRVLSSKARRAIRFLADGRSAGTNITVRICIADRLHSSVIVNNLGRVRSKRSEAAEICGS